MFNKALKEQEKEMKKNKAEYQVAVENRNYKGWDIGYQEPYDFEFQGVVYHIEPAWKLVVDDYDEYLCSIELSHREGLGFSRITSYKGETDTLDLRFARVQDDVDLKVTDEINTIILNSGNMRYAFIEGTRKYQYNINVNSEIIDFALSLNYFIKNNKTNISRLEFQNVKNRLFAIAIGRLCNEHDIDYAISGVTNELDLSETNIKKF